MTKRSGYTKRDIKNINIIIGKNLKEARKNAGMSQTDVMRIVWGVSNNRNRISEIENGKKSLSLIDLLIFQDLYSQSLDYICGLSVEPEVDMLAGTVNHIVNQSQSMIESMTTEFAGVMVNHMKSICINDHESLITSAQTLCTAIQHEYKDRKFSQKIGQATSDMMRIVRNIEVKQSLQLMAVDMQMLQIAERANNGDSHQLIKDRDKNYQYSIPLPKPEMIDEEEIVGVSYE